MFVSAKFLASGALAPTLGLEPRCRACCLPGPQPDSSAVSIARTVSSRHEPQQRRARSRHGTVTSAAYGSSVDLTSWSSPSDRGSALDFQLNGSYVAGARGRPRGVVHFVGGAFAGANPQLTVREELIGKTQLHTKETVLEMGRACVQEALGKASFANRRTDRHTSSCG